MDDSFEVKWRQKTLIKSTTATGVQKFEKMQDQRDEYISAIVEEIETRLPADEVMNTMANLDQSKWDLKVRTELQNEDFKAMLENWPKVFGLNYEKDQMVKDFIKIIEFLEANTDFWCATHHSQPTSFWSLLLQEFKEMPEKIALVIKKSLVTPLSTADVER